MFALSFSSFCLIVLGVFIFRKTISRITDVAPEVTSIAVESVRRGAIAMDEGTALAALSAHYEAVGQAQELADSNGATFNGDIVALYESQVHAHDYSRRARRQVANPVQP